MYKRLRILLGNFWGHFGNFWGHFGNFFLQHLVTLFVIFFSFCV